MTNKKTIVYDVDSVAADIAPELSLMCSKITGMPIREWTKYDQYKDYGLSIDDFLNSIIKYEVLEKCKPHDGAIDAMIRANEFGLSTAIISSRGYHPSGERITKQWFSDRNVKIDSTFIVSGSKLPAILSLDNVLGMADDYIPNLVDLRNGGVDAELYLVDQPWNQKNQKFKRVFNLNEYVSEVIEKADKENKRKYRIR